MRPPNPREAILIDQFREKLTQSSKRVLPQTELIPLIVELRRRNHSACNSRCTVNKELFRTPQWARLFHAGQLIEGFSGHRSVT
jgi:hypothetical protein